MQPPPAPRHCTPEKPAQEEALSLLSCTSSVTPKRSQNTDSVGNSVGFAVDINLHTTGLRGASIWMKGVFLHRIHTGASQHLCTPCKMLRTLPVGKGRQTASEVRGGEGWAHNRGALSKVASKATGDPAVRDSPKFSAALSAGCCLKVEHSGQVY